MLQYLHMNYKKSIFCVLGVCGMIGVSYGASFLRAESFPETFQDLSFQTRQDVLAEGYEALEAVFDSFGRCISGCPYAGMTIQQLSAVTDAAEEQAQKAMTSEDIVEEGPLVRMCDQYSQYIDINNKIPRQAPLDANWVETSGFGMRMHPVERKMKQHRGIDLAVPKGTPVYAPASGKIETVYTNSETCGRGIIINHGGGWKTQYCHLDTVLVSLNEDVQSGCLIGTVGETGPVTGVHLHYSIFYDGTAIDPAPYLVH